MGVSWLLHDGSGGRTGTRIPVRAAAASVLAAAVIAGVAPAVASGPAPATATVFAGGVGGPGPGPGIGLSQPCSMASAGGHLYFTDAVGSSLTQSGNVIRDLNERTGWMRTDAGIGLPGTSGVGGPAVRAELGDPCGLTVDHFGNLVTVSPFNPDFQTSISIVAARSGDFYGQRMRAGGFYQITGQYAFGNGIAVDYAGNLVMTVPGYVNTENVTEWTAFVQVLAVKSGVFYGQPMKAGQFYSVLTLPGTDIGRVTVDAAGNPVANTGGADVGGMTVIAARSGIFDGRRMRAGNTYPLNITSTAAVDSHGNFVFVTASANRQGNGQRLSVLAERSGVFYGRRMRAGHVYTIAQEWFRSNRSRSYYCDFAARFGPVSSLTIDSGGNWVLAESECNRVRVFAVKSGRFYGQAMRTMHAYTVAGTGRQLSDSGDGGEPTRAELGLTTPLFYQDGFRLSGVAADPASNVYLSDGPDYRVQMVPARSGDFFGQKMQAGDIYTIAGAGKRGNAASGVLARGAELGSPLGLTSDRAGNVLFADFYDGKIRVLAAKAGSFYGVAMRADRLYTIAGGGTLKAADGVLATAASLLPMDVRVDRHGNVLLTDNEYTGRVFAIAASTGAFYGQHMTAGHLYLLAGGGNSTANAISALNSLLTDTEGLALDAAGNIVVTDYVSGLVRVVATVTGTFYGQPMTAGDIYTIAGGGTEHGSGHVATLSAMGATEGLAIDRSGNVIVTVSGAHPLLQVIAARSGTFYGQSMTAGYLYTIAGGGHGLIPGNRPATKIALSGPGGVAVEPSGEVLLSELGAARVLLIHP